MDPTGLSILLTELLADCAVALDAGRKAATRLGEAAPGHMEACAYELSRFYNILEKMMERICEGFENHLDKRSDYHERLIQRLSLNLEGIRPAFIPHGRISDIRELKGFRHLTRHAYDLTLRVDRLTELAEIAAQLAEELPAWCEDFSAKVRAEQSWGD